ncbi:MAG: ABC transporter permease [Lapillicoccus sp.]
MTASVATPPVRKPVDPPVSPSFVNLLSSEWTKIRSLRSTLWALLVLVAVSVGFTGLFTWLIISQWSTLGEQDRQVVRLDPVSQILGAGFQFSQLAVCVLGVLVITSEYSTGTISSTLLAVPRRTPVLAAKSLVFAALIFVVTEIAAIPSIILGAAILRPEVSVTLISTAVLRSLLAAGLYMSVLGVFAIAIGGLLRHSAAAITGIIGFVLVLAPLALLLPGAIGKHIYAYLPTIAGEQVLRTTQQDNLLSPWAGFGVFCLWTAVLMLVAGFLLKRRDA